ncbi:MAG TPA: beta-propeller fold lactonase family protein [Terriglobales bacterium]|nr:beta-propeller fold lactonase family protein [Terriglobales bacterium]
MSRFLPTAVLLILALVLGGCGGGSNTSRSSSPPPSPVVPAFVYVGNTSVNQLTGISVAGGTPAAFSNTLPPPGGNGPAGLAATGKLLYVANFGSGTVSGFSFDANSGALQTLPGSPYMAGAGVNSLALCPGNGGSTPPRFIYATAGPGVFGYSIASTGQLTPVPGSPFRAGTQPAAVVVDSSCSFVFVANRGSNDISVFSVNSGNGLLTAVVGSPFAAGTAPMALATGDNFLFAANSSSNNVSAYTINSGTGSAGFLTQVVGSPFSAGTTPSALVYSSPALYVANAGSNDVSAFLVSAQSGNFTVVPGSPFLAGTAPRAMISFSPPTHDVAQQLFLYVANAGSGNISGFTIGSGGLLTPVQGFPFPAGTDPEALVFACGQCGYP